MDADFWKKYYLEENTPWDASRITTPIKEYVDQLTDKNLRILIPGCGNAHEAAYLHEAGFGSVYLCDWVGEALERFGERVPSFPKDHLLLGDFFKLEGEYDLILEQTFFCAIDPTLRTDYVKQMKNLLAPSGTLAGLLFDMVREDGPPFGGNNEEYQALFSQYFDKVKIAPCYNSIKPREGKELFILISKS